MKILGVDPGTVSFDLCFLEDRDIRFEESIPSEVVAERPEDMAERCLSLEPDVLDSPLRLRASQPEAKRNQPEGDVRTHPGSRRGEGAGSRRDEEILCHNH